MVTHDVTVSSPSGDVTYRYEGPDMDHLKFVGIVMEHHVVPPPLVTDGFGRYIDREKYSPGDLSHLPENPPRPTSQTEDAWGSPASGGGITTTPPTAET